MKTILISTAFLAAVCAAALPVHAQDIPYIDDRSDGAALVKSLYNAINRKEFSRAYSYFSKPFDDYQSFVQGYAKTAGVDVLTGKVTTEGAAGSIYAPVPVAIKSIEEGGKEHFFAGCYITRIVNAAIQEPPFSPLHIESAELEEVDGPLEKALPKVCHSPS
ncbi:hypothetical protein [Pararhizobium sp. O133]|uniref:hypothetical protein n=1 Tax=Pararhizobium sp. O133 TaxID=3449278 RepID=UPI003F687F86